MELFFAGKTLIYESLYYSKLFCLLHYECFTDQRVGAEFAIRRLVAGRLTFVSCFIDNHTVRHDHRLHVGYDVYLLIART